MKAPSKTLTLTALLAAALTLSACSQSDSDKTAGQKLDAAVAESKAKAEEAKASVQSTATDAKDSIKEAAADAKDAIKDTAASAERKAQEASNVAEQKLDAAARMIDDATITTSVKAKLIAADDLKALDIKVTTDHGRVILEGLVPTTVAREHAAVLALSVEGVKAVDNRLHVGS